MPNSTDIDSTATDATEACQPPGEQLEISPFERFYLMRSEATSAFRRVEFLGPTHKALVLRLMSYHYATNKPLFLRDGSDRPFCYASLYLVTELCEAATRGLRIFACPLPEKGYDPKRYVKLSGRMLGAMLRAMQNAGDIQMAPGRKGGVPRGSSRQAGYTVTEWLMSPEFHQFVSNHACAEAAHHPKILMRPSWSRLTEAEQAAFRDEWFGKELKAGRDGNIYEPVYIMVHDPQSGKEKRRKISSVRKEHACGVPMNPSPSEWKKRWDDAKLWHVWAGGRLMTADQPGVAEMMESLGRSNAFTAQHEWRDGQGRVEPPASRMGHRVFRDDTLEAHGRFYYAAQGLKKEVLDGYTVNGEETDTGDIVCTHPTMILGLGGKSISDAPYGGDVYQHYADEELARPEALRASLLAAIGNCDADPKVLAALMASKVIRQQWKRGFSVGLNARDRSAAINALARVAEYDPSLSYLCPPGSLLKDHDIMAKPFWSRARAEEIVDKLMADPVFGPSMCSGQGPRLMRQDATWIEAVRHRLEAAGIPYRDVHDSITGPISRRAEVDAIMKEEWRRLFGFEPQIKWSKWKAATAPVSAEREAAMVRTQLDAISAAVQSALKRLSSLL